MYLFYIDESGNTGSDLDSTEQPIHWLVALAVSPANVKTIERQMSALAWELFEAVSTDAEFEFKGSELFGGTGRFRSWRPNDRIEAYGRLLSLLSTHEVRLFVRGIHKREHNKRAKIKGYPPHHPHKLGFMYLVERLEDWLRDQQPEADMFESEEELLGLLVTDEQKEVDRDLVKKFASWRETGTDFGYRSRDITYLIDTVHTVPSHDSWLIQLADCVVFIRNRYSRVLREEGIAEANQSSSGRAVAKLWREHCVPCVVNDLTWP